MRLMLAIIFVCVSINLACAATRLNVVTGKSEVVADDDYTATTQINPVTGEASVQPPDAKAELNLITGKGEWSSGHNPDEGEGDE